MPLDIGIGLLGALLQAHFGHEDVTAGLLVLGAIFALLPDVDFLVSGLRKGSLFKVDHTHRDLLHHPVPYVAVGGLIVWFLAPQYTLLFIVLSLAHFVHDSMGVGWGIPWLSPLSRRYVKFFTDRRTNKPSSSLALLWTTHERDALIKKYHNPNWMKDTYGRPGATSLVEVGVLLVVIVLILFREKIL
jgi:hypothetical protein